MVKALILRKLYTLRSDPDPNLFGSCSAPEPDLDPNGHVNQDPDPDPNKIRLDPQHCLEGLHVILDGDIRLGQLFDLPLPLEAAEVFHKLRSQRLSHHSAPLQGL